MQVAMEVAGQSKKWQFLPIRSVVDEREGERDRERATKKYLPKFHSIDTHFKNVLFLSR